MRMKRFAVAVIPDFFGVVMPFDINFARIPIFQTAPDKIAALLNQNLFTRRREFIGKRSAARARADNNKIIMSVCHKILLNGSAGIPACIVA